jgi:hypothetical protein
MGPEGRYMAHSDGEQIERELAEAAYTRYAAGGFVSRRDRYARIGRNLSA